MGVSLEPRDDGEAAYCLVPRAMVFEFLPVVDGEAGDATVLAGELEAGADYELVVTTLGGLCRYRLGDVVRAVGRHGGAPLVEFRYRAGQVLNARGEKTSEAQLQAAVDRALPDVAVFAAVERADDVEAPGYDLLAPLGGGDPGAAADRLDAALREENPVYATWRDKGAIAPPVVVDVSAAAFEALRRKQLDEGASPQQLKGSRVLRNDAHVQLLLDHDLPPPPPAEEPLPGTLGGVANWTRKFF